MNYTSAHMFLLILVLVFGYVFSASRSKPHGHQGILEPYDGKPLSMKITAEQSKKLDKGEAVVYNERNGKSGRGFVVQDINATESVCMSKIRDLLNYNKMVPHVKSVDIYHTEKFFNGTSKQGAEFKIGLMGMNFGYFLLLTHEPKYKTLTWTLDYSKSSDFDDNCGHWQLLPHPKKTGWTRVLYSTKIKLFNWIPEFIINFLTGKALTESTAWVKKYAEEEQCKISATQGPLGTPSWFKFKGGQTSGDGVMKSFSSQLKGFEYSFQTQKQTFLSSLPKFSCFMKGAL